MNDGRALEIRAQRVLERHFDCQVELSPVGPDTGRDLIVHRPDGAIVVECKDWSRRRAGREVVMKLHSAAASYGAARGIVICSSGFTNEAVVYAASVSPPVELVDGQQLEAMAAACGLDGDETAHLPLSDEAISICWTRDVLRGGASDARTAVERRVWWLSVEIAEYVAVGTERRTHHSFDESWHGRVWVDPRDDAARLGDPPGTSAPLGRLLDAVEAVGGDVVTSTLSAVETDECMTAAVLDGHERHHRYVGANNRAYDVTVTPDRRTTSLSRRNRVFVPVQELHTRTAVGAFRATVEEVHEHGQLRALRVQSPHLSSCATCTGGLDGRAGRCGVCRGAVHGGWTWPRHSVACASCTATVCRAHAVSVGAMRAECHRCARTDRPTMPSVSLLISAVAVVCLAFAILLAATDATVLSLAAMLPALGLIVNEARLRGKPVASHLEFPTASPNALPGVPPPAARPSRCADSAGRPIAPPPPGGRADRGTVASPSPAPPRALPRDAGASPDRPGDAVVPPPPARGSQRSVPPPH